MPRRWLLTALAVVTVALIALRPGLRSGAEPEIRPQVFTMTSGSARRVADGRAQMWLGRVDREYSSKDGGVVAAAALELDCDGKTFQTLAVRERTSEEVCGCRVRLVEALDTSPPSATVEVTWVYDATRVQGASLVGPPPITETARSRR